MIANMEGQVAQQQLDLEELSATCSRRRRSACLYGKAPLTSKCFRLTFFQLRAAEERQDEQICQNIDDTTGQHHQTETLRRRKIRKHENGKACGNDHVRIDDPAPLFFAGGNPGLPAFLSVALRPADAKDKVIIESIAMPMQTLVAGAEMTSIGTCNQPIPPSMHNGTRLRLTIIANVARTDRLTILSHSIGQGLPVKGHVNQVRQRHDKHDRAEVDRQDTDLVAEE
jgi:hypothetical protein